MWCMDMLLVLKHLLVNNTKKLITIAPKHYDHVYGKTITSRNDAVRCFNNNGKNKGFTDDKFTSPAKS